MKKLVLAVALSAALVTNGQAASAGPLRVNGAPVDASGSYVHQNTTYVPLRTITEALRPDAEVDWVKDRAVVRAEGLKLTALIRRFRLQKYEISWLSPALYVFFYLFQAVLGENGVFDTGAFLCAVVFKQPESVFSEQADGDKIADRHESHDPLFLEAFLEDEGLVIRPFGDLTF